MICLRISVKFINLKSKTKRYRFNQQPGKRCHSVDLSS